ILIWISTTVMARRTDQATSPYSREACIQRTRRAAARRFSPKFRQFGRTKVAGAHSCRWDGVSQQAGVKRLVVILETREEEHLVAVLVEIGMRYQHRAAD